MKTLRSITTKQASPICTLKRRTTAKGCKCEAVLSASGVIKVSWVRLTAVLNHSSSLLKFHQEFLQMSVTASKLLCKITITIKPNSRFGNLITTIAKSKAICLSGFKMLKSSLSHLRISSQKMANGFCWITKAHRTFKMVTSLPSIWLCWKNWCVNKINNSI